MGMSPQPLPHWHSTTGSQSQIMLLTSITLVTISVQHGVGKHVWEVNPAYFPLLGVVGNLTGTFSILAATWSKTSFGLTLLRLMGGSRVKYLVWFIVVTVNVLMGLNAVFLWVRCTPVEKTWNPFHEGTCWAKDVYPTYGMFAAGRFGWFVCDVVTWLIMCTGYSAATEFALALLPWKVIWKLQMKRKEKVGVALAMSMGIL